MASEFPGSPSLLKGALVVFKRGSVIPSVIIFQYNPDTMRRDLTPQVPESEQELATSSGDTQHVLPPTESFDLTIELDAADQLERNDPLAVATGLHPALAELELLLYPSSITMIANQIRALAGSAAITPLEVPVVLFVYGAGRVVPVRVRSLSVTEEAFDPLLNPIRASVGIGLRSMTEKELKEAGPPFDKLGLVRLISKEILVTAGTVSSVSQKVRGLLPF
jgi:hypothetical protein